MVEPSNITGRVFVVGCDRSGTTLLQSMLAAHPRIMSFPETQFFNDIVGQEPRRVFGQRPLCREHIVRYFFDDWRVRLGVTYQSGLPAHNRVKRLLESLDRPDLLDAFPDGGRSMSRLTAAFVGILDLVTLEQKKDIWLEKSPRHLNCIDIIERYVPRPKFVHTVRAGQDNVASLYDAALRYPAFHWGQFRDIDRAIDRWNIAARQTKKYAHKPNHQVIRHEWLVDQPQRVLANLCDFIGVDYLPQMVQIRAESAEKIVRSNEPWKQSVSSALRHTAGEKFDRVFTDDQKTHIAKRLEPLNGPLALEAFDRG